LGRAIEGLSSNCPELLALGECLEAHEDNSNLLYLTDSEAFLQAIHEWIGCGAKLNIARTPDADVLKETVIKLQKRGGCGDPPSKGEIPQGRSTRNHIEFPVPRTVYKWKEKSNSVETRTPLKYRCGPISLATGSDG
jgi:hypothetical protein